MSAEISGPSLKPPCQWPEISRNCSKFRPEPSSREKSQLVRRRHRRWRPSG
ncbi:hypothetical protein ABID44_001520 [Aquamicrobium ahrensii]|uniref:Uncharacterized protein n=1 Tax=Aquamicrobium ahrensii TaxID=469551 RepID=A0ABV2KJE4_9HYPH